MYLSKLAMSVVHIPITSEAWSRISSPNNKGGVIVSPTSPPPKGVRDLQQKSPVTPQQSERCTAFSIDNLIKPTSPTKPLPAPGNLFAGSSPLKAVGLLRPTSLLPDNLQLKDVLSRTQHNQQGGGGQTPAKHTKPPYRCVNWRHSHLVRSPHMVSMSPSV
eukprot:sb/3472807/